MKMFMAVKVQEPGVIQWNISEGAALSPGEKLATLELDDPSSVTKVPSACSKQQCLEAVSVQSAANMLLCLHAPTPGDAVSRQVLAARLPFAAPPREQSSSTEAACCAA